MRRSRPWLVAVVVLVAGCGTGHVRGLEATPSVTSPAAPSGAVTSGLPDHVLWQLPLASPTVVGDSVVGWQNDGGLTSVLAVDAATGRTRWSSRAANKDQVLHLAGDAHAVLVETGSVVDKQARAQMPVVTRMSLLDAGTGRLLWDAPVVGDNQNPPIVLAAGLVVSGDPHGAVTARSDDSGAVVWQKARPAACAARANASYDEGLAADGSLLVVSFRCTAGRVMVQRLLAATGAESWQWTSAAEPASAFVDLHATAAAVDGSVVVLTGQVGSPPFTGTFFAALPHPYEWPATLGPDGPIDSVLTLDAGTGRPRWSEVGAQQADLVLVAGRTCEAVSAGFECRDDVTGETGAAAFASGNSGEPPSGDGHAGMVGGSAYVALGPVARHQVVIARVDLTTGAVVHRTVVPISTTPAQGAVQGMLVQRAVALSDGRVVALMQRVDDPADPLMGVLVS